MVENEEEPAEKTVCEEDEQQMEEDNPVGSIGTIDNIINVQLNLIYK